MEIKLDDEAFNKLQKKVIEELVAKLKLLERKTSLLSKENSLQSGVIMQLKKYHSTKSKMLQHCDRGHLFCKKIHARYNYVADHCHYETNHKNDFKVHTRASHGRVKNPCDESQYTASSNRVLSKHIRSVHQNKKYTCENCQFSTNSAKFLQIHEENSHNKREGTVHRGADYDEALSECVKGKLKLKNEFTLRKHRGAEHDEALHECVKCQLKFKNESVLSKHIQYKHE